MNNKFNNKTRILVGLWMVSLGIMVVTLFIAVSNPLFLIILLASFVLFWTFYDISVRREIMDVIMKWIRGKGWIDIEAGKK